MGRLVQPQPAAQRPRLHPTRRVRSHLLRSTSGTPTGAATSMKPATNPRRFTPTSASWLNLVEVWFGIIERQAIHRGSFASVTDLNRRIRAFIDGWNDRAHPFVWTKTAEHILAKADRQKTSD